MSTPEEHCSGFSNPFKPNEPQYHASQLVTLPVATSSTPKLIQAALHGLRAIWKSGVRYKKAGVLLLDLSAATHVQGDLWTAADDNRSKALMGALDSLNGRYGRATVTLASTGRRQGWRLRAERRSARYTTDWQELLRVVEPRKR